MDTHVQVLLLGARNYPLHPFVHIQSADGAVTTLLNRARQEVPDLGYDDIVRAIWAQGLLALGRALDAGARVERLGVVRERPVGPPPAVSTYEPLPRRSFMGKRIKDVRPLADPTSVVLEAVAEPEGDL